MVRVFREISKTIMFVFIWGAPIYMAVISSDTRYLWMLPLSLFASAGIFSHYEKLELIEDDDEKTQETGE